MAGRRGDTRAMYGARFLWLWAESRSPLCLLKLPAIRQPSIQFGHLQRRQVHQQLREIHLRIDFLPAAGAGQALARMAAVRPPRGLPTKREFFRFNTIRFISRSLTECRVPDYAACRE
jgi:hypothetical protein